MAPDDNRNRRGPSRRVQLLGARVAVDEPGPSQRGLAWQAGVWDGISRVYVREIDLRFAPIVDALLAHAALAPGERVLDLGTGTGSAAILAANAVGPAGAVTGVDISREMLALARERADRLGLADIRFVEGAAERIPVPDAESDVVLACLSLMFVTDRNAAAREIARVLGPTGRFVAAVWAGPEECDLVRFQQTAGRFSGPPPVPGVGPGSMADPRPFLEQLANAGIQAHVECETFGLDFADFRSAWDTFAGVTATQLPPGQQEASKAAVATAMDWSGGGPRHFRNATQFIMGKRVAG